MKRNRSDSPLNQNLSHYFSFSETLSSDINCQRGGTVKLGFKDGQMELILVYIADFFENVRQSFIAILIS
jgi:hypothetical protein